MKTLIFSCVAWAIRNGLKSTARWSSAKDKKEKKMNFARINLTRLFFNAMLFASANAFILCSAHARDWDYGAYDRAPSPTAEQLSHFEELSRRGDEIAINRSRARVMAVLARHFGVSVSSVNFLGQPDEPTVPVTLYSIAGGWTCAVLAPGMGPGVNCSNSQTGAKTSFRYGSGN